MKINKFSEKGQALVIIALAAVVLFGFAALAIDGSRTFSDKRHAQNAADTGALAGVLAYTRGSDINAAAQTRVTSNGYDNGEKSDVTITTTPITAASGICPGNVAGMEVRVDIRSYVDTTFARVIGTNQLINNVSATGRGCGFYRASLFNGNAIVGLNPTNSQCGYDTTSASVNWNIEGGGIFSNGCAYNQNSTVDLNGYCVTSVGNSTGFSCEQENQSSQAVSYPDDVLAMMPPNPCPGIGLPQSSGVESGNTITFSNGVYCISNMDALDQRDIMLNDATLYVTDLSFDLKFAGSGGFYGTPSSSGDYANYYMIIAYNGDPCTSFTDHNSQVIEWRGNGSGSFSGTVFAPSACIDLRGNADQSAMQSQIIAYNVGSNGDANVYIQYQADQNASQPIQPNITLVK